MSEQVATVLENKVETPEPKQEFDDSQLKLEGEVDTPETPAIETETPAKPEIEKSGDEADAPNFNDFLKERGLEVETPKVEPSKLTTKAQPVRQTVKRDLTWVKPEDKPLFEKMANDTLLRVKDVYTQVDALKTENEALKKTEGALPSNYYEHEKGYLLSPDYEYHATRVDIARQIKEHWQKQLLAVKRGQEWQDIDLDQKTGTLIKSKPITGDDESEIKLQENLQVATEQLYQISKKREEFVGGFTSKHKADVNFIKEAEEKYFTGWDKAEHWSKKTQDEVRKLLPDSQKGNPLTGFLGKTLADNAALRGKLKLAVDEIKKLRGIKSDEAVAQPVKKDFVAGNGKSNGSVKFGDFLNRD